MYVDIDDANKIKATDGTTTYTNATDAGDVLNSIFTSVPISTYLYIKVYPGTYQLFSWNVTSYRRGNFTIEGSGMGVTTFIVNNDLGGANRVFAFEANGSFYPSTTLSVNVARDAGTVVVTSTSGLAAGDYIMITSTALWEGPLAPATKSEVNRIVSISGNTLTLEKRTRDSYATADAASVRKVDFLVNLTLRDFTIKAVTGFTRTDVCFMRFDWCDNRTVENVELVNFKDSYHKGFVDNCVINSSVGPMRFYLEPQLGDFIEIGPYAISCRAACDNIRYHHCTFHGGIRHAFTTTTNSETAKGGIPRNIHIEDCNSDTTSECSFDTHGEGDGIYFSRCSVHSFRNAGGAGPVMGAEDTDPFNTRCKNTVFENCKVFNTWGNGISTSAPGYGHTIKGCYIRNVIGGTNKGINCTTKDTKISDCDIADIDGPAIHISQGVDDVIISDTKIRNVCRSDTRRAAIRVESGSERCMIDDCQIRDCPDNAIRLEGSNNDCTINGNMIVNVGQTNSAPAVYINNSTNCVMNNNRITGCDRPLQMAGTSDRLVYVGNNTRGNDKAKTTIGANNTMASNNE